MPLFKESETDREETKKENQIERGARTVGITMSRNFLIKELKANKIAHKSWKDISNNSLFINHQQ